MKTLLYANGAEPKSISVISILGWGRLKGGANRAIARGPKFWGAHELFEKFFFYYLYEKKNFFTIFLIYY